MKNSYVKIFVNVFDTHLFSYRFTGSFHHSIEVISFNNIKVWDKIVIQNWVMKKRLWVLTVFWNHIFIKNIENRWNQWAFIELRVSDFTSTTSLAISKSHAHYSAKTSDIDLELLLWFLQKSLIVWASAVWTSRCSSVRKSISENRFILGDD